MYRKWLYLSLAAIALSSMILPANAQTIIKRRVVRTNSAFTEPFIQSSRSDFSARFSQFSKDLDEVGDRMRDGYTRASAQAAQSRLVDAQSAQTNNKSSQEAFNNGEAHSLNSGGLYNTPGRTMLWGNHTWLGPE